MTANNEHPGDVSPGHAMGASQSEEWYSQSGDKRPAIVAEEIDTQYPSPGRGNMNSVATLDESGYVDSDNSLMAMMESQLAEEAAASPTLSTLERAIVMGDLLIEQIAKRDKLTEELKKANADVLKTESEDLPSLMKELKMKQFAMEDGTVLGLTMDTKCSVSEDRRPAAFKWCRDNGFGGLIKVEMVLPFGRGDYENAEKLRDEIQGLIDANVFELDFPFPEIHIAEEIHHSTLKSFVVEQMTELKNLEEAEANVPADDGAIAEKDNVSDTLFGEGGVEGDTDALALEAAKRFDPQLFGVFQREVVKVTPPPKPKASSKKTLGLKSDAGKNWETNRNNKRANP